MTPPQIIPIQDASQSGAARRASREVATLLRFPDTLVEKIAIVVTELATNILKHAGSGEVHLIPDEMGSEPLLQVLALDRGPGIVDWESSLRDGYSSVGTAGTGLGAAVRLSQEFDIYTQADAGSAIYCGFQVSAFEGHAAVPRSNRFGFVQVPKPGQEVCGDGYAIYDDTNGMSVMVVDGLGHGPNAAYASHAAVEVFRQAPTLSVTQILQEIHRALKPTRGAAVAVARVDYQDRTVRYGGIGNITAFLYHASMTPRHLISMNGIAGHELRRTQELTYSFDPDSVLVMYSDGLVTQVRLESYPGLTQRLPPVVAGVLYRDFARMRDDATVLVIRLAG